MAVSEHVLQATLKVSDQMSSGLNAAKNSLKGLESGFEATEKAANNAAAHVRTATKSFEGLQASGEKVRKGIEGINVAFIDTEKAQAKFAQRAASLTNKMLGLHLVTNAVGRGFGKSELGQHVQAGSDALQTFGGIVGMMPSKLGLAVGAGAALLVWLKSISQPSEEAKEALEKLQKQLESVDSVQKRILAGRSRSVIERDVEGQIERARGTNMNDPRQHLKDFQARFDDEKKNLEDLKVAYNEVLNLFRANTLPAKDAELRKRLEELKQAIELMEGALPGATKKLENLKAAAADRQAVVDFTNGLKKLGEESVVIEQQLETGLITPLQAAEKQAENTRQKLALLFANRDTMDADRFELNKKLFMDELPAQQKIIDAGKLADEQKRLKKLADARREAEELRERERRALKELENQWGVALPMAVDEYVQSMKTAKDFMVEMFQATQGAMTTAFESLLSGGKRSKDTLKAFLKDMRSSITRSVSELLSQSVMKQFAGLMSFGGGAGGAPPEALAALSKASGLPGNPFAVPGMPSGGGGGVNLSSLGGNGSNIGGMFGLDASTGASIAGALAGGAVAYQGMKSGSMGSTVGGMAMAGMSIGALAGPIGAVAGLAIGAIAGAIMGSRAKRRAKKKRRAAEAAARAAHEAAVERARVVLKGDIRNKMGGGLSTEEAANEVGALFSNDLSESEIMQFGDPAAIAAKAGEVNRQTTVNAPISVTAYISGKYDIAVLSRDLSYHLQAEMGGAAHS